MSQVQRLLRIRVCEVTRSLRPGASHNDVAPSRAGNGISLAPCRECVARAAPYNTDREAAMASARKQPPWKRSAPKGTKHRTLSAAKKRSAKAAAKRAGRPYPNLVDNMRAAKKKSASRKKSGSRSKTPSRKKAASRKKATSRRKTAASRKKTGKRATKKSAKKGAIENPRGGLTAAGRRH